MTTTKDSPDGQPDPPDQDYPINPTIPTGGRFADSLAPDASSKLLELTVTHPATGVCVVEVGGELDAFTAPLLNTCIREQLVAAPTHLILDLQPVRFLGSAGLACLLEARALTQQTSGMQLLLAGLATRAVARPLQVTELLDLFDAYPILTDALAAVTG